MELLQVFDDTHGKYDNTEEIKAYILKHKQALIGVINLDILRRQPQAGIYQYHAAPLLTTSSVNNNELVKFLIQEFHEHIDPNVSCVYPPPIAMALIYSHYDCALSISKHPKFNIENFLGTVLNYSISSIRLSYIEQILASANTPGRAQISYRQEIPNIVRDYILNPQSVRIKMALKHRISIPQYSSQVFCLCLLIGNKILE